MKVLLVVDHAPDYREEFFRELASYCDLTVAAQPCNPDSLSVPAERIGYHYIELPVLGRHFLRWQVGLISLLKDERWDVRCVDLNIRQASRVLSFFLYPRLRSNWVWRGHIFGRHNNKFVFWLKRALLKRTHTCLVYSEPQAGRTTEIFGLRAISFNNTEVRQSEFRSPSWKSLQGFLNFLYVGRNQDRKKLTRLIRLAERNRKISVRLIGPGMEQLPIPEWLLASGRVEVFGKINGTELNSHFDWADLVANPGHAGLLVMNAARHGKGIVVDNSSDHAPEYWLAKESGQPFIDFSSEEAVDRFVNCVLSDCALTKKWGYQLQQLAMKKYTIENMAHCHFSVFQEVARGLYI